jgi:hypothetical protein
MKPRDAIHRLASIAPGGKRALFWARRVRAFLGKGWVIERAPIIVSQDEDLCLNPIFVIGTHRSGTSLVRRILDSHPNIACPPESFFLSHYSALLRDDTALKGISNLGFSREEALAGLRRGAAFFHEAYRRAKNKPRWADKTPSYAFHLDTIESLFGPGCRYVFVFRHPLDVAYSIWKRGWTLWEADRSTGDRLADTCRYVADSIARQLAFMDEHRDRSLALIYDRLVSAPEPHLRRLCDFLGEPFAHEMLEHHKQPHDSGTEDPVVRGIKGFSASEANWLAWPKEDVARAWSIVRDVGESLGYLPDNPRRTVSD